MKKILTVILIFVFSISCSDIKKSNQEVNSELYTYQPQKSDCIDSLSIKTSNEITGPINLRIKIESIQIGEEEKPIGKLFSVNIDKESELITFGDNYALKFFHLETIEYGNLVHLVRYDFFVKDSKLECWIRRTSYSYSKIKYFESEYGVGSDSFSMGEENSRDFIKIKWSLTRIK